MDNYFLELHNVGMIKYMYLCTKVISNFEPFSDARESLPVTHNPVQIIIITRIVTMVVNLQTSNLEIMQLHVYSTVTQ